MGDIMIPATPEAGTADPSPLVTQDDYERITGDCIDPATFDYFLDDALDQVQRKLSRTLLYAQYNERLFLYQTGQVYGTAIPYDTSKPVQNPIAVMGSGDPANTGVFQGYGIWVGWYIPLPALPVWQGVVPPQTDIKYWGGFVGPASPLVAQGRLIPASLKRAICKVVWFMNNPALMPGYPVGAKSISVGGVSISGDLSSMVTADKALACALKKWRHPMAHSWAGQTTPIGPGVSQL